MDPRTVHSQPRAHWLLLALALVLLLGGLCLNGYVQNIGSTGTAPPGARADTAAAGMENAGPVLRWGPRGGLTSARVPAGTLALTFDDGPDPVWTPRILEVLRRHHAHATFFVIGSKVSAYPALARRIVAEGHELGVHTYTHLELTGAPAWQRDAELSMTQSAIAAATGRRTRLMRPPYSSTPLAVTEADAAALREVAGLGYLTVLADRDSEDWRRPGAAAIVRAGRPARGTGAIVLMHDSGGDRSQTVRALDRLLGAAPGYRFETVSAALRLPSPLKPSVALRARGQALRVAQVAAGWLGRAMTAVLTACVVLAALRLVVQVSCARRHVRRHRRSPRPVARPLGGLVSIVVPAFNEAANIAATVRSLAASDYPQLEVIVVDDGSSDATAAIAEGLGLPGVRVIRQENAGKPAALNTGIAAAQGDVLVLVDGDTVFGPGAVRVLAQHFADPRVGAVSGNTKVANRQGILGRWQHLEYVIGFNLDRRMFDLAECMLTVPGAIGAFRRTALAEAGGVSGVTLAEDTDLTMAVLRGGWRVVYEESAIAWTEVPSSLSQLWRQRYRWCYGTMQAMWKHRAALAERGPAGRFGRRGLGYLLLFQVLTPLLAPAVDVYAVYAAIFLPWQQLAGVWLGFLAVQAATAAYALHLDGERWTPLWSLPLQQIVYRQLLYLVVVQSAVSALVGTRQRWQQMHRTGQASLALTSPAHTATPAS